MTNQRLGPGPDADGRGGGSHRGGGGFGGRGGGGLGGHEGGGGGGAGLETQSISIHSSSCDTYSLEQRILILPWWGGGGGGGGDGAARLASAPRRSSIDRTND